MGDFPAVSREAWLELVTDTLKGKPFDKALVTTTLDGIELQPLYETGPATAGMGLVGFPSNRPAGRPWQLRSYPASLDAEDLTAAEQGGADAVWLDLTAALDDNNRSHSLDAPGLAQLLSGLDLTSTSVAVEAGANWLSAAQLLTKALAILPDGIEALGSLRCDPVAALARTGQTGEGSIAELQGIWMVNQASISGGLASMRWLGVDASVFADAGASEAQELGLSLASAVWYLRELTDAGLTIDEACAQLEFSYVGTADIFATLTKLRAARLCWQRVAQAVGASTGSAQSQYQHVVSSKSMLTRYDPTVNVLRTTAAAFAAVAGGADAITILPHDFWVASSGPAGSAQASASEQVGNPQRLARNISHILLEESQLAHVADPASGSGYVEEVTEAVAGKAWELFQQIEAKGGIMAVLKSGEVAGWLADTWQQRQKAIRHRRQPICGVSEFPDLIEVRQAVNPGRAGPAEAASSAAANTSSQAAGLPVRCLAEPFESLRDRAADLAASAGQPPKVFLAVLGSLAVASARVTFAENLLAAGGIVAVLGDAPTSEADWAEQLQQEFKAAGTAWAVLCSSDEVYETQAGEAVAALQAAGCAGVYLAGRIGDGPLSQLELAGSMYAGCDAVAFLDGLLSQFEAR